MNRTVTFPQPRRWALITGGSHGIGRALALECVRRDLAVAIVALPNADLTRMDDELAGLPGCSYAVYGTDLTQSGAVADVMRWLEMVNIQPSYLINNAGFGRGGLFEHTAWEEYRTMLQLNNQVMVDLTYALLPSLKRSRGGIMNMSSVEATLPLPYKTVYTGTKAFVYNYSLALREEMRYYGIDVSVLCPGPTITNADGLKRVHAMGTLARIAVTLPEDIAAESIDGMLKGKAVIRPGALVKFMALLGKLVPRPLKLRILERMFSKYRAEDAPVPAEVMG